MAFRNSATQSIRDKDSKELVILIKARDLDIQRLKTKVSSLEAYQKRRSASAERELKKAQDETKKARADVQALQTFVDEAKSTEKRLRLVIDGHEQAMNKKQRSVSELESSKFMLVQKKEALTLQVEKFNSQLRRLRDESSSFVRRVKASLQKIEQFFEKLAVNHKIEEDYSAVVCDLQFLSIEIKAFESQQIV